MAQATQAIPSPVRNFFARFLARPDDEGLREFCIDLLDLEVSRAKYNVLSIPPLFEASKRYRSDITQAARALRYARQLEWLDHEQLDLLHYWLTLLGHRLAAERGLSAGGIAVLTHIASARLGLPLKETEAWSKDTIFETYTRTALRDEWDYPGIQFRYPRSTWPPEAV